MKAVIRLGIPMGQALFGALLGAPKRNSILHSQLPTPTLQLTSILQLTSKLSLYCNRPARLALYQGS